MKSRNRKLVLIALVVAALGIAVWLVLNAFKQNLVFFYTPTQVAAGEAPKGRTFRIGGLVENGSLKRDNMLVRFTVTDTAKEMTVVYNSAEHGPLPDLFKEGKGVVAEGQLDANGQFDASMVLAKHDENYMPPEAATAVEQAQKAQKTLSQ